MTEDNGMTTETLPDEPDEQKPVRRPKTTEMTNNTKAVVHMDNSRVLPGESVRLTAEEKKIYGKRFGPQK